ncbi:MAG: hypothetical protein AAF497_04050 [Planctomycetota bacterium]
MSRLKDLMFSLSNGREWAILALLLAPLAVCAHEAPINLFVDAETNRLFTLQNFAPGRLTVQDDGEISTTTPGLGVSLLSNGVVVGSDIIIDAMPGLYYFNGSTFESTLESMRWFPPEADNLGNPTGSTGELVFSESSGAQYGMPWATYINSFFWEADGTHVLSGEVPAPGIVGVVIRVRSSLHLASEPFVVPFVYDPDVVWSFTEQQDAVEAIRLSVVPTMPGDFDGDLDMDCNDVDALVSRIVDESNDLDFDLNGDELVTNEDLDAWLDVAAMHNLLPGGVYQRGDVNLDGFVDVGDFNLWNANRFTDATGWCRADVNADGLVDVGDFNVWNRNKFSSTGSRPLAVPEPAFPLAIYAAFWLLCVNGCRSRIGAGHGG